MLENINEILQQNYDRENNNLLEPIFFILAILQLKINHLRQKLLNSRKVICSNSNNLISKH